MAEVLEAMTPETRAIWVERLRVAAANLSNAAYALAGNVPEAQPDPMTWATTYLALGAYQVEHALEGLGVDQ